MTDEERLLIAKYDGWQWESEEWDGLYIMREGFWYSDKHGGDVTLDEAPYDTDWNWLIPVVAKVMKELANIPVEDDLGRIGRKGEDRLGIVTDALIGLEIALVYKTTVEAIQLITSKQE